MKNLKFTHYFLFIIITTAACGSNAITSSNTEVNVNTATSQPAATPADGSAAAQIPAPELLVADLYKQHDANKSPFFQKKDRALVDKFFTKPLAELIWKDSNGPEGEMGVLVFDPLYDAQDTDIKDFAVGKANIKGETASVMVNFTNFAEKHAILFTMKLTGGNWKIDDIKYDKLGSLLKMMKEDFASIPKKDSSSNGEFEGKYQVGETTCTVKPVKMAFEIKWAKGAGTEMFFSKGENTFGSEESDGKTNRFVFDDENYNSGTFYRRDGKTFTVSRIR